HRESPTGRVFTRFEWSEYITWSLGPDFTVFMDGRIEIFPDEVWDEYSAVTSGRADWQKILDKYQVDYLLIDAGPRGYHARLRPLVEKSNLSRNNSIAASTILLQQQPLAAAACSSYFLTTPSADWKPIDKAGDIILYRRLKPSR